MVVMNIMTGWGHNSEMFIRMKCVCVCVWGGGGGVLRMRKCVHMVIWVFKVLGGG